MVRYFWVGQCDGEQSESGDGYKENKVIENTMGEPGDGEQSESGDGYKENKVIENTMGEPGDGEQSGQGGEEYSCKDNTEFVYNVCITYSIIIPLFHF